MTKLKKQMAVAPLHEVFGLDNEKAGQRVEISKLPNLEALVVYCNILHSSHPMGINLQKIHEKYEVNETVGFAAI
ncbi:hypothetical protein [Phormidesmis sp. 146-33]